MPTFRRAVSALGFLALFFVVSNLLARQSPTGAGAPQRLQPPPLFFREDWKLDPKIAPSAPPNAFEQEHTLGQGDVANPNLELKKYGDTTGPVIVYQPSMDNITFAMTLLCTSNCAQALRRQEQLCGPHRARQNPLAHEDRRLPSAPSDLEARRRHLVDWRPLHRVLQRLGRERVSGGRLPLAQSGHRKRRPNPRTASVGRSIRTSGKVDEESVSRT